MKKEKEECRAAAALCKSFLVLAAAALLAGCANEMPEIKVHFIDVGQGDSAFVDAGAGGRILIDCGKDETAKEYLDSMNITSIDALIISHNDNDHSGGCRHITKNMEVIEIYTSKNVAEDKKIKIGELEVQLIAAYDTKIMKSSNDNSLLAKISYGKTRMLFTGDCGFYCESEIMRTAKLRSEILKVSHHGSKSATSEKFLDAVSPKAAVISVGKNSYGHPSNETLARINSSGADSWRTDIEGPIIISTDGRSFSVW